MEYLSKAGMNKKAYRNYIIKISVVGTISLVGFILGIYSVISKQPIFAIWYFIAFVLGLSYAIIRINAVFPTYIATDGEKLVLSTWNNGIVPYKLSEKPTFISDFIPDKVKTDEVQLQDIALLAIGSMRLLKKVLSETEYPQMLSMLEKDKHFSSIIKRMDFFYVMTKDGENCFMSINDFDINEIALVIETIEKNCMGIQIQTNLPKLVKIRDRMKRA